MQPSLFADPSQPTTAHAAPSEATDAPEPAPKPRSARKAPPSGEKAPKVKATAEAKEPLPFMVADALAFIAEKANGRFVLGDSKVWGAATFAKVSAAIRAYPNPDDWRLVGEWCAAGWADSKPVSFRWTRSDAFLEAFAIARSWSQNGRELHFSLRKNVPFVAKTNAAPSIPEGHRRYAPSAAQRLANATGKAVNSKMPTTFDDDRDYDLSAPDCPVSLAR